MLLLLFSNMAQAQANDPFSDDLTVSLVGAAKTVVGLALPTWLCPAMAWAPTVSQEATAGHVLHVAFLRSS